MNFCQAASPHLAPLVPQVVCDPVALDGLEALEVQQALRILFTRRVPIKHCLHICQSCVHNAWVSHMAVLDYLHQLRAVQCGAGQLVGEDKV